MKKLMFAAAVAAGVVCGASAVESGVVGYTQKDTDATGAVGGSGSFVSVSGADGKFNICDLSVDSSGNCSGAFVLQSLTTGGYTDTANSFWWFDDKRHGGSKGGVKGWYTTNTGADGTLVTRESGKVFPAGNGFWIVGKGLHLISSGSVYTNKVVCGTDATGAVMIANPYPVAVNIADLTVNSSGNCSGAFVLQALDVNGYTDTANSFWWFDDKRHGGSKGGTKGWYTTNTGADGTLVTKEMNKTLAVGGAFWVVGKGLELTFPGLNLNK